MVNRFYVIATGMLQFFLYFSFWLWGLPPRSSSAICSKKGTRQKDLRTKIGWKKFFFLVLEINRSKYLRLCFLRVLLFMHGIMNGGGNLHYARALVTWVRSSCTVGESKISF